jgi:hypothetical protein
VRTSQTPLLGSASLRLVFASRTLCALPLQSLSLLFQIPLPVQGEGKRAWRARVRAASTQSLTYIFDLPRFARPRTSVGLACRLRREGVCGRSVINETAVTQHQLWPLPSPSPWTGRGIGKTRLRQCVLRVAKLDTNIQQGVADLLFGLGR